MADYFCDHTAYASVLGTAPTWGVPQEGDGSSKDAATASSTASIFFTGNLSAGNTISVCGVTFTGVSSGATGNQFNIGGSLSVTIDNIVAAINASSTVVGSGVAPGTPQLRNLVFARNTAGNTLDVMMRVGSATLNGANNTNCRLTAAGVPTSTTLPVDFAGGSGGCWGLLISSAAMGVSSSYAALAYGLMVMATPICAAASSAPSTIAVPGAADKIYCRTGAGSTITCAVNTQPSIGAPTYVQNLVFDSNTVWTGDSGAGQITISMSLSNADCNLRLPSNTSGLFKSVRCLASGGLRFYWSASNGSGFINLKPDSAGGGRTGVLWERVTFETPATLNTGTPAMRISSGSVFCALRMKNCNFLMREPRTTFTGLVFVSGIDGSIILEGCRVEMNHTGGGDPGAIVQNTGLIAGASLKFIGCSFSGWPFGRYRVFNAGMSMGLGSEAVADGCTGINIGTTYVGVSSSRSDNPNYATVVHQSLDAGLAYRYEYAAGVVDWNPDAAPAYPTRSALLGDGATSWSVKLDWFASTVNVFSNLATPRMGTLCRLPSAARTVAVDFLSPVAVTAFDVAVRVYYVSTDDKVYCETTYGNASAMSSPGATWAGISNFPAHSSKRLTLTTSQAVKQNTEVAVVFEATGAPPGGTGVQLYVDPEFALS